MRKYEYDAVVVGGGAAGMAAAREIRSSGVSVAILEREEFLGGILMQCVHNGFGLRRFKQELTGPEYAETYKELIEDSGIDVYLGATVVDISVADETADERSDVRTVTALSERLGALSIKTRSVVLAMGCRERNRGNIGIPGTRPSGIFTAGLAQRLLNIDGYLPGRRVVIVGSGDIGLIMARRLSWVECEVLAVVEIMPFPSGITRNIVQCLEDFDIPLYLSHTITRINGADRVESVDVAPLENGMPVNERKFNLQCDTVLLSVGLVPENELSRSLGVELNPDTNGPVVDSGLMTNVPGVFACGNVLHVHDLVDFVSEEGEACGGSVAAYLANGGKAGGDAELKVAPGANLKYVVPNYCSPTRSNHFFMRSMVVADSAELRVSLGDALVASKKLKHVKPAEMIEFDFKPDFESDKKDGEAALEFSLVL